MAIHDSRHLISIDEYHRMGEAGIFAPNERVELIEGEILAMSPIGNPHATVVRILIDLFSDRLRRRVLVDAQDPVLLGDWSEPQPDVTLLVWRSDHYASAAPTAKDVVLVIEVADSSVAFDRKVKAPLYARHGIREYWLMDLPAGRIEVYRQPAADGYREVCRVERGESIAPEAFPGVAFTVDELLG